MISVAPYLIQPHLKMAQSIACNVCREAITSDEELLDHLSRHQVRTRVRSIDTLLTLDSPNSRQMSAIGFNEGPMKQAPAIPSNVLEHITSLWILAEKGEGIVQREKSYSSVHVQAVAAHLREEPTSSGTISYVRPLALDLFNEGDH